MSRATISISMSIQGDRELVKALTALPVKVQTQIGRKALRPAAQMLSRQMKAATPTLRADEVVGILTSGGKITKYGEVSKLKISASDEDLAHLTRRLLKTSIKRKAKTYRNTKTPTESVGVAYDHRIDGVNAPAGVIAERVEMGDAGRGARPWIRRVYSESGNAALSLAVKRAHELVKEAGRV